MPRPSFFGIVLGDRRCISSRTDHGHLQCIVDDWSDRQHRRAVGRADHRYDIFALDKFSVLSDGPHRVVLVVTCDKNKLVAFYAALLVNFVDRYFCAPLDFETHVGRRTGQGAGETDLDVFSTRNVRNR